MDTAFLTPLVAAFVIDAAVCGAFVFMHRTLYLALLEVFHAGFAIGMIISPRAIISIFITSEMSAKLHDVDVVFIILCGGLYLIVSLLSYLTRRSTNEESVMKSLLSFWIVFQMTSTVFGIKNLVDMAHVTKTVGKGADKKSVMEYDFTKPPQNAYYASIFDACLVCASLAHAIRWRSFKTHVSMASTNCVNKFLLAEQVLSVLFGTIYVLCPELLQSAFVERNVPMTDLSSASMRFIGLALILLAMHNKTVQDYYNDKDKVPYLVANCLGVAIFLVALIPRYFMGNELVTASYLITSFVANAPIFILRLFAIRMATCKSCKKTC